jgi:hypothetical protein
MTKEQLNKGLNIHNELVREKQLLSIFQGESYTGDIEFSCSKVNEFGEWSNILLPEWVTAFISESLKSELMKRIPEHQTEFDNL